MKPATLILIGFAVCLLMGYAYWLGLKRGLTAVSMSNDEDMETTPSDPAITQ